MPMLTAEARVATTLPRRYLGQLCKHFQHKLLVTLTEDRGRIEFPTGVCTLQADQDAILMQLTADNPAELIRLQDVVGRHLVRFAFRDELEVHWA